jgi:CheY-like chemotaxis protein
MSASVASKNFSGSIVLIVDDEPDLREIIQEEFESLGAKVHVASNGREALNIANQFSPQVIISDIRMPGGDGIELLKNVRSQALANTQPVFVLVTGFSDVTKEQAAQLGADLMLSKPFHLSDFTLAVEKLLRARDS